MDSMNYNWLSQAAAAPAYPYLGYGPTDRSILPEDMSNTGLASTTHLEDSLDSNPFLSGSLEYSFDAPLGGNTNLTPLPNDSVSPPARTLSVLRQGSVDGVVAPEDAEPSGRRSSSEEKDVTPAQSRRKAQNRAAQRAFRERKERHVRDLEAKLNLLTTTTSSLQSDNERLKLMLQRVQTENEMLKASKSASPGSNASFPVPLNDPTLMLQSQSRGSLSELDASRSSSTDLSRGLLSTTDSSSSISSSPARDGHLLSASATWDLLQSHPLYLSGAMDIGEVCDRLKRMARCEGMGPMFREEEVRQVIDQVRRNGRDEPA